MDDESLKWFCYHVTPKREFASARILLDNGVRAFCPIETKLRRKNRWAKFKVEHDYPLLLGYIFVALEGEALSGAQEFHAGIMELFRFRFVKAIVVGEQGRPLAIPTAQMDRVFFMSKAPQPYRKAANPHRAFRIGEDVEIISGPFAGRIVKIEDIKGKNARIILQMFGREQEVPIPLEFLEVA